MIEATGGVLPSTRQMGGAARRTISRDLLAAMERSNPLEAALANLLIEEGSWAVAD